MNTVLIYLTPNSHLVQKVHCKLRDIQNFLDTSFLIFLNLGKSDTVLIFDFRLRIFLFLFYRLWVCFLNCREPFVLGLLRLLNPKVFVLKIQFGILVRENVLLLQIIHVVFKLPHHFYALSDWQEWILIFLLFSFFGLLEARYFISCRSTARLLFVRIYFFPRHHCHRSRWGNKCLRKLPRRACDFRSIVFWLHMNFSLFKLVTLNYSYKLKLWKYVSKFAKKLLTNTQSNCISDMKDVFPFITSFTWFQYCFFFFINFQCWLEFSS